MGRIFGGCAGLRRAVANIKVGTMVQSGRKRSCQGAGAAEALEREADHCSRDRGGQERGWSRQRCLKEVQGAAQFVP
jgi:hypothetical protein